MIPKIFENNISASNQRLIAYLPDCISCTVTEERNSVFECYMTYPVNGNCFNEIQRERVLLVKANHSMEEQFFRIYRITKPLNGIVSVYAQHISYDLSNIPVMPFSYKNTSITTILDKLFENSGFTYQTNYSSAKKFTVTEPKSIRACLGGEDGSILSAWHGEFTFDNFTVKFQTARGTNRGVSIEYGKNLTDIEHDVDNSEAYTHLLPYAINDNTVITLDEKTLAISDTEFSRIKTFIVDLSEQFDDDVEITKANLKTVAQRYISENLVGTAIPSITVSFEPFTSEGNLLDRVDLCDTVTVRYPVYNIEGTAKVTSTIYNTLLERYESITLGELKSSMADTLQKQISKSTKKSEKAYDLFAEKMDTAVKSATETITGAKGGNVVIKQDNDGKPIELLIMDTNDTATATKVWRWNSGGLGYSSTGYSGTYGTAITSNGEIVANYITSGSLTANVIKAGKIESLDKASYWDIESGDIKIKGAIEATSLTLSDGVTIPFSKIGQTDTSGFLIKGGAISRIGDTGTITEASKAFEVSNDGLLIAANAVIYGGIYASYGTIAGWEIAGSTNRTNGFWPYSLSNIIDEQLTGIDPTTGKSVGMTRTDSQGNTVPVIKNRYAVFLRGGKGATKPSNVVIGVKQMKLNSADTYVNEDYGVESTSLPYSSTSTNWTNNSDYNFSVTASGEMTAKKGNIAGFNISSTSLTNGEFGLYPDGIKLPSYTVKIVMMAGSKFYVFKDGTLYCSAANITGNITATSLTLGDGVTLDYDNDISGNKPSTENFLIKGGAISKVGSGTLPSTSSDGSGTCFSVSSAGLLKAENAVIGGTIYAGSGVIGGWNISDKYISYKSSSASWGDNNTFILHPTGTSDSTSYTVAGQSVKNLNIICGSNFGVDTSGTLYAKGAKIAGEIKATSGEIGGWKIGTNLTYKQTDSLSYGSNNTALIAPAGTSGEYTYGSLKQSGWVLGIGSGFGVDNKGHLEASDIKITGGQLNINGNFVVTKLGICACSGMTATSMAVRDNFYIHDNVYINCKDPDASTTNYKIGIQWLSGSGVTFGASSQATTIVGSTVEVGNTGNTSTVWIDSKGYIYIGTKTDTTAIYLRTTAYNKDSAVITSDAAKKYDVKSIDEKQEKFFKMLNPVNFKFIDGTSNRDHTGFIAQEVKEAINDAGLTTNDVAAYVEYEEEGQSTCGLRYEEFIALNTYMIQKLMKRIEQLENKINSEV